MSTATKETKTLTFYTLGPEFTNLVRDFITEGSFYQAYEILKDCGAPSEWIKSFFNFTSEFVGDTRDDSFGIDSCDSVYSEEELDKVYFYALNTLMSQVYQNSDKDPEFQFDLRLLSKDRNYKSLLNIFSEEKIIDIILPNSNLDEWYNLNPDTESKDSFNAVITTDGRIIECDYQGHQELYFQLYPLKLVDTYDWAGSEETFHISSGEIVGGLVNGMDIPKITRILPTEKQIATLFKYRKRMRTYGFGNNSVANLLLEYTNDLIDKGGKFNNLMFLHQYYPEINLPEFSLNPLEGNMCIRTSPKYSMPGLLNSKFKPDENSIKEIEEDFEKFKGIFGSEKSTSRQNKLHYFYQEFIKGMNGVAHFRPDSEGDYRDKKFTYSISSNQGDIVNGIRSQEELSYSQGSSLEKIVTKLGNDLEESIQVEFVINNEGKIYIVQLRILKREPSSRNYTPKESYIIFRGKSFSSGTAEVSVKDVLVINSDCDDPSELIGKKALIVRDDVEFSHILALSKSLGIPSIYAIGHIKLPDEFKIDTKGVEGLILKK